MAICLDYETFYSSKLKYGLKQMIAETYVQHEMFDPYMLAVCDGTTSWAGHPKNFNWNALEGQTLLSHNRYFDNTVYDETVRRGWVPLVKYKSWECTANLTSYLCNRRALDHAVEFLYGIRLDKSARANADGKHWPNDFSEEERAGMLKYAPLDAYWGVKIWNDHAHKWPEVERRLSNLTIDQGRRGIQINTELLDTYVVQAHEMKMKTESILPWIAGAEDPEWDEFTTKPTSTKCIAEMCRKSGIPCPPVKAHEGEEAFEEWEALYGHTHPWISALSSWRSINKLYKSFLLMKQRVRPDGTMPFGLKYFGAHTGRWAGSEKINFQNPRKKPVLCKQDGLMETNAEKIDEALKLKKKTKAFPDWVKHSIDFRALLIPRPGKKMITCDLSQIEPRVLAWLTGNTALLNKIREGYGVYESFARTSMDYVGEKMDKDSDYYKMIKIQVLGLGYQAGWEKFITIAAENGVDITKDDPEWIEVEDPFTHKIKKVSGYGFTSKKKVQEFRDKNPKIAGKEGVGIWSRLDQAFKQSIGGTFVMTLPSGRKLTYRDVRCTVRIKKDPETGKPRREWVFTAESNGRQMQWYGGKLTENITQATARDIFGVQLIDLLDAGHWVLFTSHDEAICEVDMHVTAADIEAIMSKCPEWMPGLPVAAEAKEVAHYTK